MSKDKKRDQLLAMSSWMDRLYQLAEQVIHETNVESIEPFELLNLLNVRLHMEDLMFGRVDAGSLNSTKSNKKPNLVLLDRSKKDKDDSH